MIKQLKDVLMSDLVPEKVEEVPEIKEPEISFEGVLRVIQISLLDQITERLDPQSGGGQDTVAAENLARIYSLLFGSK